MFDELSTHSADYQAPRTIEPPVSNELKKLEKIVATIMTIEQSVAEPHDQLAARFAGQLMLDSAEAYERLDEQLAPLDYHAYLTMDDARQQHIILILKGRYNPKDRPWWPNLLLFVLTVFSTMWAGAVIEGSATLLDGWPYALCVLLILGAHELGHYFAARHHHVAVTLPYFIPLPPLGFGLGTMGAFIQLRQPMRNRKQLFDVGIAGPLAGLFFTVPILLFGIVTAEVNRLPTEQDCAEDETQCVYLLEGNSVFYYVAKRVIHGEWLPTEFSDMTINQVSFAGWTGLFVTGLNLIPVGQLDGGHLLYTLNNKLAKRAYYPAMGAMILLALNNGAWWLWVILLFFFGRVHAVPLDDVTPLDNRRRILGIVTLLLFFLIFTPVPFTIVDLS